MNGEAVGSLRKRDSGRWQNAVQINGERHYGTFDTKTEAKEWEAQLRADAARGQMIAPTDARTKYGEWADRWMASLNIAEGSRARYRSVLRCHILPRWEHVQIGDVTTTDVRAWLREVAEANSNATANSALQVLSTSLNAAVDDRMIGFNPCDPVSKLDHQTREMEFLTPDEVRLVEAEMEPMYGRIVRTLAFLGCRWGEMSSLQVEDVNLLRGTVRIDKALDRNLDVKQTKTGDVRILPIPEPLRDTLEAQLQEAGSGTLFTNGAGNPLRAPNFRNRHWYPALEAAGIERHVRPHDLRHTCASWLITGVGANPVEVCRWLGHSRPSQTLDTYSHLFAGDLEDLSGALADIWERRDDDPDDNVREMPL